MGMALDAEQIVPPDRSRRSRRANSVVSFRSRAWRPPAGLRDCYCLSQKFVWVGNGAFQLSQVVI